MKICLFLGNMAEQNEEETDVTYTLRVNLLIRLRLSLEQKKRKPS